MARQGMTGSVRGISGGNSAAEIGERLASVGAAVPTGCSVRSRFDLLGQEPSEIPVVGVDPREPTKGAGRSGAHHTYAKDAVMAAFYGALGAYSRSRRAIEAQDEGRYPITVASGIVAKSYGISRKRARQLLEEIGSDEWHHVGKYANHVYFYETDFSVLDLAELSARLSPDVFGAIAGIVVRNLEERHDHKAQDTPRIEEGHRCPSV